MVQRRLAQTRIDAWREFGINGLGGSEAVAASHAGCLERDGVVVEIRGHGVPDFLVEAVVVTEVYVIAAEAAIVFAGD